MHATVPLLDEALGHRLSASAFVHARFAAIWRRTADRQDNPTDRRYCQRRALAHERGIQAIAQRLETLLRHEAQCTARRIAEHTRPSTAAARASAAAMARPAA